MGRKLIASLFLSIPGLLSASAAEDLPESCQNQFKIILETEGVSIDKVPLGQRPDKFNRDFTHKIGFYYVMRHTRTDNRKAESDPEQVHGELQVIRNDYFPSFRGRKDVYLTTTYYEDRAPIFFYGTRKEKGSERWNEHSEEWLNIDLAYPKQLNGTKFRVETSSPTYVTSYSSYLLPFMRLGQSGTLYKDIMVIEMDAFPAEENEPLVIDVRVRHVSYLSRELGFIGAHSTNEQIHRTPNGQVLELSSSLRVDLVDIRSSLPQGIRAN